MPHEGYHEPYEQLPDTVRDMHRAIVSLMEELEAVDWYYQRAAITTDESLRAILLHNAHEEIEHAMMALEWIRRVDPTFDKNMREFLFRDGSIVGAEAEVTGRSGNAGTEPRTPVEPLAVRPRAEVRRTLGSLRDERGTR